MVAVLLFACHRPTQDPAHPLDLGMPGPPGHEAALESRKRSPPPLRLPSPRSRETGTRALSSPIFALATRGLPRACGACPGLYHHGALSDQGI